MLGNAVNSLPIWLAQYNEYIKLEGKKLGKLQDGAVKRGEFEKIIWLNPSAPNHAAVLLFCFFPTLYSVRCSPVTLFRLFYLFSLWFWWSPDEILLLSPPLRLWWRQERDAERKRAGREDFSFIKETFRVIVLSYVDTLRHLDSSTYTLLIGIWSVLRWFHTLLPSY